MYYIHVIDMYGECFEAGTINTLDDSYCIDHSLHAIDIVFLLCTNNDVMILTQVSYLDCVVFLVFLIPQLLLNVDSLELVSCGLRMLPFVGENQF